MTSAVGSPLSASVLAAEASSAVVVSPEAVGVTEMIPQVEGCVSVNLVGQEECAGGQREEGARSRSVTTPIARVVGRGAIVLLGVRIGSSTDPIRIRYWNLGSLVPAGVRVGRLVPARRGLGSGLVWSAEGKPGIIKRIKCWTLRGRPVDLHFLLKYSFMLCCYVLCSLEQRVLIRFYRKELELHECS